MEKIGDRIKELRRLNKLTQIELGEKLFVSDKTVSKWEQNKSEPDLSTLITIATFFDVSIDYLITGENNVKQLTGPKRDESGVYYGDDNDRLFTRNEVTIILEKRRERWLKKLLDDYKINSIKELDEVVERGKLFDDICKPSYEDISKSFDIEKVIGLETVKNKIDRIVALSEKNKYINHSFGMNYAFLGNPGTGKTMMARIFKDKLYEKGVITKNILVEASRANLIGRYTGQTAPLTTATFKEALGGVLFIDEAYSLMPNEGNDYCAEALSTLNKLMEDYAGKIVVIFAGYSEKTKSMISANPGLKSRINSYIDFPDYSNGELNKIFLRFVEENQYLLGDGVEQKVMEIVSTVKDNFYFGNARGVRKIFETLVEIQAYRTKDDISNRTIEMEDVLRFQIENKAPVNSDVLDA